MCITSGYCFQHFPRMMNIFESHLDLLEIFWLNLVNSFNARVWTIPISTFCKSKHDASPKASTSAMPEARDVTVSPSIYTRLDR